jgi:hypothetical protein
VSAHVGFVAGLLTAGYLVAALFFLKFWRRVGDGLFLAFAAAFALLALQQALPVLLGAPSEAAGGVYMIRLAAFLLIIGSILRRTLPRRS